MPVVRTVLLQVRIELYLECPPLPLETFKSLIRENMLPNTDKFQVRNAAAALASVSVHVQPVLRIGEGLAAYQHPSLVLIRAGRLLAKHGVNDVAKLRPLFHLRAARPAPADSLLPNLPAARAGQAAGSLVAVVRFHAPGICLLTHLPPSPSPCPRSKS